MVNPTRSTPRDPRIPDYVDALLDPLVTMYRENLEAVEAMNRTLMQQRNDSTEHARYVHRRLETADAYIAVLEARIDDLEAVVTTLLNTNSPHTREDTQETVRLRAEDSVDADYLWRLLLEADTEPEEDDFQIELDEQTMREIDEWLDEADEPAAKRARI